MKDVRMINLIEANFNFNNKVIARLIIKCTEENNLLPAEQYGSRKLHCMASQAINKRLVYNISDLQRRPMVLHSNNAKACYDCVMYSIASLVMQ